ncbi:MAG: serpin family protein [Xanthobacteraceae bacterium]
MRGVRAARRAMAAALALAILVAANSGRALAQDAPHAVTAAYNASGQALFRMMAARPGNIAFSPYSIGTAMAMALAGARGETEREMAAALRHGLASARIGDANAAALSILNGYDRSKLAPTCPAGMRLDRSRCVAQPNPDGTCSFVSRREGNLCVANPRHPPSAKLLVANALMLSRADVSQSYMGLLKDKYGAEVFRDARLDTVNGWVKRKTEGKIEKLLERMSDLVLLNAVYFKARWARAFDAKLTKDDFFNVKRTRQELVPTMLQRAHHSVVQREGYRAIRLPYAVRELGMVVVLPDEVDGVDAVGRRLDMAELSQLFAALRTQPARLVMLSLPRFKTEFKTELTALFQEAGIHRAFDLKRADFSGMTGVPASAAPTAIDQIVHRAVVEVAEESTEAAAATGIGFRVTSAMPKPVEPLRFRVDRPFLYYIVDEKTGAVLFQGRVVDPR